MSLPDDAALDYRVMQFADRMQRNGATEDAESVRASMAYLREAVRGADQYGHLTEDLDRVAEAATDIAEIIRRYADLGDTRTDLQPEEGKQP